ncbi:replication protein P [Pseudomonas ovata]|uniref:replication protein P n=1 Tax=Pseudomonas ovata TaxID=1839709 RepID=UPI00137A25FC|nr:replication protein P [Pseudomonas ovata]
MALSQPETDELKRRVAVLFATFQVCFANQFDWDFPANDAGLAKLKTVKSAWLRIDLGRVPGPIFEYALGKVGTSFKKIPTLKDFLDLCSPSPEVFGLPSVDKALREATENAHPAMASSAVWSHDVVYHAATEVGFHNLRSLGADSIRRLFERSYTMAVRAVMRGEPLRVMPKALPAEVSIRTPEVGQDALAALRAGRGNRS